MEDMFFVGVQISDTGGFMSLSYFNSNVLHSLDCMGRNRRIFSASEIEADNKEENGDFTNLYNVYITIKHISMLISCTD